MAIEVDLGNGQTAIIREPGELRSGDQDAVLAQFDIRQDADTNQFIFPGDMSNRMRKALLRRIIDGWNLSLPLPKYKPKSLDELTLAQQKALFAAIEPHMKLVNEELERAANKDREDGEPDPTNGEPGSSGDTSQE